ncbi:uncharacterized protein LOC117114495 [Anneissia japonica]|uniref:uncharacterized protein LOC117114495 n=1 Tax=Anneissia japonica TaxID=1529436 RepID=UPI001425A114|nr:uncharacterized protein LOC117114495 [Anneissia japonica]
MAGANIGLSMLSRGIGAEKEIKGHRKLEVSLEPEDYHNIQSKKFYLPPIQQQAWQNGNIVNREMMTHKTFTTRKGALLLYAEDLASAGGGATDGKKKALEAEDSSLFSSTNEFCSAILSYGAKGNETSPIFLNFVKGRSVLEASRSVRPGFSAKRYMANWSRSWDDSVLNKLRSNGNIWDKNLFQPNAVNPSIYRRINDDLSQYPSPYHVTRSMLLSPGGLQQYEFYRVKSNISDEEITEETEEEVLASQKQPLPAKGKLFDSNSIAVVERDKDNKPHLVSYKDLDEEKQTAVLQRLLVQSVLSHQQSIEDLFHEKLSSVSTKSESGSILESPLNLDIGQAIVDLITSNSTQLQVGNPIFTDASYIKASPTQLKAQQDYDKRVLSHNSGRGQYSTLPPINNIPALRPLKVKPLGGGVLKLPPLPTKSESPHSGSHYCPVETQSNGWESNFASDDSEHWQGNVAEEVKKSMDRLKKLGSPKSSSNNSLSKVPVSDLSVTVGKSMHGSVESLAQPSSDISIGVKGGYMPKWQEKSMVTYKAGVKSSSSSVVMGPDGDMLAIGNSYVHSLASASEFGNDDVNEDVITDQDETQSMSSSKVIQAPGEGTDNIPLDTSQNDLAEPLPSHQIGDVDVYEKTQSDRQGLATEDAVILNGEPESITVQPEHAMVDTEGVLEQPEIATTADEGDVQINQDDVKQSINEDGKVKEDKDGDNGQPVKNIEETDLARSGQPANNGTPEIAVVDVKASNGIKEDQESIPAKDGVEEAETSSSKADDGDDGNQEEQDREPGENGSVVSAASVIEDIVEQALKVAETVIQRPKSGRDLAADAKEAAGMWAEQLKNIFSENCKKLERSASETLRFRSWSSNSVSSTDSFGVGSWVRQSSKAKDKKKSKLRVHSAEAAISVIKNFINQQVCFCM